MPPNACFQRRRWQASESARAVARHHAPRSRPAQRSRQRRPLQSNVGRLCFLHDNLWTIYDLKRLTLYFCENNDDNKINTLQIYYFAIFLIGGSLLNSNLIPCRLAP